MIEMIISDMDGTLLNQDGLISKANIETIKKAKEQGILFAIASGRALTEAKPILEKANLASPMITGNGAQGFDASGNNLFTYDIPKNITKEIIDLLNQHDVYFEIATTKGVFSVDEDSRIEQAMHHIKSFKPDLDHDKLKEAAISHLKHLSIQIINNYDTILANPEIKILKFIVISEKGEEILQPLKAKIENFGHVLVTSSFLNNIEINALEATKGNACKALAKHYHKDLQNTLVLGDNYNDESMFKVAGHKAAMDNAVLELKEMADYISDTHHQDGVAKAINHFIK